MTPTWLFGLVFLENGAKIREKISGQCSLKEGKDTCKIQAVLSKLKKQTKIQHKTIMLSALIDGHGNAYFRVLQQVLYLLWENALHK